MGQGRGWKGTGREDGIGQGRGRRGVYELSLHNLNLVCSGLGGL